MTNVECKRIWAYDCDYVVLATNTDLETINSFSYTLDNLGRRTEEIQLQTNIKHAMKATTKEFEL